AFARARVLGANLGDPAQVVLLLFNLMVSALTRDGPQAAQPLADQALVAAEQAGRPSLLVLAHFAPGRPRLFVGDLAGAREHCGRALALYDEATQLPAQPHDMRIPMYRIQTLSHAARIAWRLGRTAEARGYAQEVVQLAERDRRPAARASAET